MKVKCEETENCVHSELCCHHGEHEYGSPCDEGECGLLEPSEHRPASVGTCRIIDDPMIRLTDASHKLAMYVLQSELYRTSMNVRDAVDAILTITTHGKGA